MEPADAAARRALVAAGVRLGARGLIVATEGNLSVRLGETLLITPAGRRKDELEPDEIVRVPLVPPDELPPHLGPPSSPGGPAPSSPGGPAPSSDLAIHRAIYRARPDVAAIAHAHLPAALALTLVGEAPDPAVLPESALLLPELPVVPYGVPGSLELAQRVAATLAPAPARTGPNAVLLERHGAIAVGPDLATAVDRLELVELLCRVWRDARLLAPRRRPGPPSPG
ncbi:MAG TPA: class II aldolase/adducin family protein [Candidatus Limnocylindrales bacterium]|nr:class II aldolase/adducin family protein [Candidatus Limnocylindrales bacterium]